MGGYHSNLSTILKESICMWVWMYHIRTFNIHVRGGVLMLLRMIVLFIVCVHCRLVVECNGVVYVLVWIGVVLVNGVAMWLHSVGYPPPWYTFEYGRSYSPKNI